MPRLLASAAEHYRTSALLARQAVNAARSARKSGGNLAAASAVASWQAVAAYEAETAVAEMLLEQRIQSEADALLASIGFTTEPDMFAAMADATKADDEFDRLVESLLQDAARAAESVAVVARPHIYHVRYVNPPCCGRCAVLAGRVYKWSTGFERHPGCDCVMVPTTLANDVTQDPGQLFERGLVRGLSRADTQAINDGADLGQVVNVRSKSAGLMQSGRVLARADRPTPEGIYRAADGDRDKALSLLKRHGYLL